jgi:hypothetical protein
MHSGGAVGVHAAAGVQERCASHGHVKSGAESGEVHAARRRRGLGSIVMPVVVRGPAARWCCSSSGVPTGGGDGMAPVEAFGHPSPSCSL